MRVLLITHALEHPGGIENYVCDVATALLRRGHTPAMYATRLGALADALRQATVPVVGDPARIAEAPDLIHGQYTGETLVGLLCFPTTPAAYFLHDVTDWRQAPPLHPRVLRHVAVDAACRDMLVLQYGVPAAQVRTLLNFVDLERFRPRPPLPARPRRAVWFSNYTDVGQDAEALRDACARLGIALDVVGTAAGNATGTPEQLLPQYDLVFAKGRSAIEALAVGTAVILVGPTGMGPLVSTRNIAELRPLNFGRRVLQNPVAPEAVAREIERYDAADATEVSRLMRASAGLDSAVDELLALYAEIRADYALQPRDPEAESRAAATTLRAIISHPSLRPRPKGPRQRLTEFLARWRARLGRQLRRR